MKSGRPRCCNYWAGHQKGHQFSRQKDHASTHDPSLLAEDFLCTWNPEDLIAALYKEICRSLREGDERSQNFYCAVMKSSVKGIRYNRTGFTYLSQCPVYILLCDILQRTKCGNYAVKFNYTSDRSQATVSLRCCPTGCGFGGGNPWHKKI